MKQIPIKKNNGNKVIVIGLDGATFDVMDPLIQKGKLPNIATLMENGTSGKLISVLPAITSTAWTSFSTGKNPAKHGIFGFTNPTQKVVTTNCRDGEAIWNIVSYFQKKVGVVHMPFAYPPEEVNGFFISGLGAPGLNSNFAWPEEVKEEALSHGYSIDPDLNPSQDEDKMIRKIENDFQGQIDITLALLTKYEWDLFIVVFNVLDYCQHFFWKYIDSSHPQFDSTTAEKYKEVIPNFYQRVDEVLGKILEKTSKQTTVIILSDHGFGACFKHVHLNTWLIALGLLKLKSSLLPKSLLRCLLKKIGISRDKILHIANLLKIKNHGRKIPHYFLKMIPDTNPSFLDEVNWSKTKVYSTGSYGNLHINLKGREIKGIVSPGSEYEELINYLIQKLRELRDPKNGKYLVERIYRKEEVYSGKYLDRLPDLIAPMWGYPDYSQITKGVFQPPVRSGDHRIEGIFIAFGPEIKKRQRLKDCSIMDVTPTILHYMGLPISEDMDGQPLIEIFHESSDSFRRKASYKSPGYLDKKNFELTQADEESLKEKLRGLGYLS